MKKPNVVSIPYLPPKTNIFIEKIYGKIPRSPFNIFKRWKYRRKIKRFREDILRGSPSFHILWQMADFIKIAEFSFFYNNSINNSSDGLYSSKSFSDGQNGFRVCCHDFKATIKLLKDDKKVLLEIVRMNGDKLSTLMSFSNDSWDTNPTMYDEILLDQIIHVINCKVIDLFDRCYEAYMCL